MSERCAESPQRWAGTRYPFFGFHIAFASVDPTHFGCLNTLARELDRSVLIVPRGDRTAWAWVGGRQEFDEREVERVISGFMSPAGGELGAGEPLPGIDGWRLTHQQSLAALKLASRYEHVVVRYREAPILIAALSDQLLASSLRALYLKPLEQNRDGGRIAKATLRAYLSSHGNASSAAAALGVNRGTIANRLALIEECFGQNIDDIWAALETALALDELADKRSTPVDLSARHRLSELD